MKIRKPYRIIRFREKVKILLVELINRNLGDTVIADNAAYLARRALPRLAGRHYVLQQYDIYSEDYELAGTADLIIFAGGGVVKYRQERFYEYVPALLDCAQENGIPVYFHCIGVEGYDAGDERCLGLARALRYPCVKGITVRDDLETLRRDYLSGCETFTAPVIDTAVYTPEVYGIQRDPHSRTIGLGIVRWRIFADYGIPQVTREFQLEMWKGIARELEAQGYRWKLFVNGLRSDYDFAEEVLAYMGRESQREELLARRPAGSRELVETIASFEGVIACRMHASIIAYALGIPSVGLVWNSKMDFWGERIGYPERFLHSGQFEPGRIAACMSKSIASGVRPCPGALKKSVFRPLQKFIRRYGAAAWKKKRRVYAPKPLDWADRLAAAALGGINRLYANMNNPQALENSLAGGFRILEADIRLTTDGKLVCVNGWSRGSYEKLGADPRKYDKSGMDYDTFMKCRMYDGHYETMDAARLLARMRRQEGGWKLILDIGKPNKQILAQMILRLQELCAGDAWWEAHLLIRLQSRYDVAAVQEAGLPVQIMYYVPPRQKREEGNLKLESIGKFCRKQGIRWVSMPREALDEEVMEYLKKEKLRVCVFSYNTYGEAVRALALGVDWIATSYLRPAELAGWYEEHVRYGGRGIFVPVPRWGKF